MAKARLDQFSSWMRRFWSQRFTNPQQNRLRAALKDAEERFNAVKDRANIDPMVLKACSERLAATKRAFAEDPRFNVWDSLHGFDAAMLGALNPEERAARWHTLRAEARDKLKGSWRGEAVEAILKQGPEDQALKADPRIVPLELLRELHVHLATAAQNKQFKLELFERRTLPLIALALAATVAITFLLALGLAKPDSFVASLPWLEGLDTSVANRWAGALTLGMASGALGGIMSMSFSLGQADLKAKIPEMRLSRWATVTRPFLGAAAAIPIVVFVEAGFVTIKGFEGALAIFAFCFIGGFSERWFLGVMERFEAGKK